MTCNPNRSAWLFMETEGCQSAGTRTRSWTSHPSSGELPWSSRAGLQLPKARSLTQPRPPGTIMSLLPDYSLTPDITTSHRAALESTASQLLGLLVTVMISSGQWLVIWGLWARTVYPLPSGKVLQILLHLERRPRSTPSMTSRKALTSCGTVSLCC